MTDKMIEQLKAALIKACTSYKYLSVLKTDDQALKVEDEKIDFLSNACMTTTTIAKKNVFFSSRPKQLGSI